MSDSSTSAIDDKNNENNNNSDDSDSDNWGGFALSLLQTSIFYFLVILFASGYIFWTRVPYQLIMEIFPTLDSKFGREFYCPESCKKGRTLHKEELKKRAIEIEQRRKQREENRMMENNLQNGRGKRGGRVKGGSAKCSQAKLELEKTHSFKINKPTGMMSFPYNLNDGNPTKMGTWFASSTQWVYIIYRWIIVTLLGWEVVKPEDSSNADVSDKSKNTSLSSDSTLNDSTLNDSTSKVSTSNVSPSNDSTSDNLTNKTISTLNDSTDNSTPILTNESNIKSLDNNSTSQETNIENLPSITQNANPTSSIAENANPTSENTGLKTVEWDGGAGKSSEIEMSDINNVKPVKGTDSGTGKISAPTIDDLTGNIEGLPSVSLPEVNMPKISKPSFLNEDRDDDSENTMTNRFATYPGPLLFIMSMGVMLYFMTLLISTGLLTAGSGLYACWNAGFPWGFGYLFLFFFMSHFMGGINIVYQFLTGLYYFLIYPFMVNPNVVGEKFKYYPGFICSCNAGFLLVIYGLFILMAAGSNLTGSTQLGLGIGYYSLMILGLLFSGKK